MKQNGLIDSPLIGMFECPFKVSNSSRSESFAQRCNRSRRNCWTSNLLLGLLLYNVDRRPNNGRLPLLNWCNIGGWAMMVERKTGGGLLLRWLQVRNWTIVIRVDFIGFHILADKVLDQLLRIMRTGCVNTSTNLIIGSTLVRDTKLSSSVIQFLRSTLILFTQCGQWITKNQKLETKLDFLVKLY
jgi:hypothetical protein